MKTSLGWILTVLWIAQVHHAIGQVSFAPAVYYPVGTPLSACTAADVNGDGKVDLIVASVQGNTLTVLTNKGNGVFGSNATYSVIDPRGAAVADINGDGKVDLICPSNGKFVIFTNAGGGAFILQTNLSTASYIGWVLAADVNGDGQMDLIGGDQTSYTVLTNAGGGHFATASTNAVGCVQVALADVNGDGKVDIIGAAPYGLVVLTNAGNGRFSLASTNALATGLPGALAVGDVNGDGRVDVIVPDYDYGNGTTLTVFTNNGNSGFGSNATYAVGSSSEAPYSTVVADLDGKGKLDLISGLAPNGAGGGAVIVLTNDGSGGFGSNVTFSVGSGVVLVADVNGDGRPDLIACDGTSSVLSVLINTSIFPPPTFTPTLNINGLGNGMLVSWPSGSAGWSLQQTPDLAAPAWSPSGYGGAPITDNGTNKSLFVTPLTGNMFFRLMHP